MTTRATHSVALATHADTHMQADIQAHRQTSYMTRIAYYTLRLEPAAMHI